MLSSLGAKLAMRKAGIPSNAFDFSSPEPAKKSKKDAGALDDGNTGSGWPAWMTIKSLPLTVQPWLAPPPPPIPVAEVPKVGDLAPLDRDRRIQFGGGRKVLIVFLRCVGCAFAQRSFLALRTLANRYPGKLHCIAVSHSSPAATQKWLDLIGGAWTVEVIVDEDRAVYAAWGLGLGSVWYVFNPASQIAGFKDKGWLGARVAESIQRTGSFQREQQKGGAAAAAGGAKGSSSKDATSAPAADKEAAEAAAEGPVTTMGNKWQETGAFAIDGRGTVVWGGKAARADEVLDLDAGIKALGL